MGNNELSVNNANSAGRSSGPDYQDWVEQTLQSIEIDARAQPWKKTFSDRVVDSGFDDGQDIITIKKTIQQRNSSRPRTPEVQGNSLAA